MGLRRSTFDRSKYPPGDFLSDIRKIYLLDFTRSLNVPLKIFDLDREKVLREDWEGLYIETKDASVSDLIESWGYKTFIQ